MSLKRSDCNHRRFDDSWSWFRYSDANVSGMLREGSTPRPTLDSDYVRSIIFACHVARKATGLTVVRATLGSESRPTAHCIGD